MFSPNNNKKSSVQGTIQFSSIKVLPDTTEQQNSPAGKKRSVCEGVTEFKAALCDLRGLAQGEMKKIKKEQKKRVAAREPPTGPTRAGGQIRFFKADECLALRP